MSRIALITGALGGVGRATAAAFRAAGWTTAGVDRRDPDDDAPLDLFERVDLSHPDVAERLAAVVAHLGGLDALVNNAAMQLEKPFLTTTVADWDAVMNSNLRGAFLASQAASSALRRSGGAIVNVGSVHALATSAGLAAYATSKGALAAYTRVAALELAPEVRVNAVLPGAVDTPMLRSGLERRSPAKRVDEGMRELAERTPLRRVGRPDEVAEAILFLADASRSSFITGQTLIVDGGAIAHLSTE